VFGSDYNGARLRRSRFIRAQCNPAATHSGMLHFAARTSATQNRNEKSDRLTTTG